VSDLGGDGDGRCARLLPTSRDDAAVDRSRRLVLLLHRGYLSKDEARAKEPQVQGPVEGEPAPKELVGGYYKRASAQESAPHRARTSQEQPCKPEHRIAVHLLICF